ncbi:hypothetical protein CspHIS471_0500360 [Cutaneotrichosporon sp. HIS471]|nr:hypothetical protein CspHIS471_0500360 [Cutaneotrichosporon sp. HIS471]
MRLTDVFKRTTWVLPKEESCIAPQEVWSNKDMDPTPPEHRTWTSWTFFAYWVCDLFQPGGWATVAAFVASGLTWWESCLAVFVGASLASIVIASNSGTSTRDMLSFFIFWVIQFPLIFIHPSKLKWIFNIKAIVVPIVALGTMIWALKKSGSMVGPALRNPVNRVSPGTARFVAFMYAVTSVQGVWATMSMNVGDFSRYLVKPKANLVQLVAFPAIFTLVSIVAAITATALLPVYGDVLYQPYMIIAKWPTSHGGRAAMFLGGLAWALANATTNVTANSISAANDMVSLAPKDINIRRGQFISATVGVWAFAPWKVLASAQNFLSFMAAYSVILAPLAALMACDYFIVKRKRYNVYHLYRPNGIYHYLGGWNWRAYVALLCAVAPNLPGMANAINTKVHIGNIKYVYMVSNIVADIIAITEYYSLSRLFPDRPSIIDEAVHDAREVEPAYSYDATQAQSEIKDMDSFVFVQSV